MLAALNQLNRSLSEARSLDEIAELAATTLAETLPERGLFVQLYNKRQADVFEAAKGPEMSGELFSVPLGVGKTRAGEITLDARDSGGVAMGEEDCAWVAAVAASVTAATREFHARSEHRDSQLATVLALARLLERRDSTLGRHFDRLRNHCRSVAEELRVRGSESVDSEFIENLSCACILHDLGKVAIPDSILLKPGRLSPEEWEVTKTHTLVGAATIEEVLEEHPDQEILALGRDIALQHHERWNGEGYPNRLIGDEISLAARIVAVCDVYDALTHDRPFRPAWTHEKAVEWIDHRSGEEFDPFVVECFLARSDEIEAASRRMPDLEAIASDWDAAMSR